MNTQANNKVIADFLGWKLNSIGVYGYHKQFDALLYNPITGNDRSFDPEHLSFHVSWEWIMLAVYKIESLGFEVTIHSDGCYIAKTHYRGNFSNIGNVSDKLSATYQCVLEFVDWHLIHYK